MKKNQISLLLVTVASAALFCQSTNATTVLTEQFAGYNTGMLGGSGAGDTGGIPGWYTPRAGITVTNGSGGLDGTGLGLVAPAGDMVYIASGTPDTNTAGIPNGAYNKFANKNTPYPAFPTTNAANLYCSFLYRFNVGTDVPTDGAMIAEMNLQSAGIQSGADAYWELFARNVGGNIQLGIAKMAPPIGTAGITNWASTNITVGQTFFVVIREQILSTNGVAAGTNEIDDLWINPPHSSFGAAEASVPTPSASSPISDGIPCTSATGPGRFFIVDDGPGANFDELRISTNWADVTPPLGQCNTAGITTDLTNITQSAEINASFFVGAVNSTSPSYQWQISQNGGSTWANISGAVHSSYTTPNLQLATDNGNQYRAIVSVACDSSSVTSSVSTVTLTAPVVTPPGLVMYDNFSSGLRGNPPVTANNSVWYTSVSADLSSFPSGPLVGTTISNTSSMWLGYFVDESTTNLPVDLAVGSQITVTLPFIPNSFTLFTTNGPMRFGLFDYADGGTPVTADGATVTGSTGNGAGVRGYMLGVDFGQIFTANSNLTLYARTGLGDGNLMSATSDYLTIGTGPIGGAYLNKPAFQAGTNYTLVFTVARTDVNTCTVTGTILTNGTSWLTLTSNDTNGLAYHRFDAFSVWNNKGINSADSFNFPYFQVQVIAAPVQSIRITNVSRVGNNVTLTWSPTPAGSYTYTVLRKINMTDATWTTLLTGVSTTSYTDTTATGSTGFYRVTSP